MGSNAICLSRVERRDCLSFVEINPKAARHSGQARPMFIEQEYAELNAPHIWVATVSLRIGPFLIVDRKRPESSKRNRRC
jgi:hypothetical protein